MKTAVELTQLFRNTGRKVTAQRLCVWRLLEGNTSHPSAEVLFEEARRELETISLRTVYQVLRELEELGECMSLDLGTGASRFDPNVDAAHHHLVCTSCGKVRDLYADFPSVEAPKTGLDGFQVGSAEIVFRGTCAECKSNAGLNGSTRPKALVS
ncbi:MAG: transcriptional repressor [Acidimicrobiales bacterium]|nr:transcriptional repressor [Acidimicrobiales bacterium]